MQPARTFEDLIVWQKAHLFALGIYQYTRSIPKEERYALTSHSGKLLFLLLLILHRGLWKNAGITLFYRQH